MKSLFRLIAGAAVFFAAIFISSYCMAEDVPGLVDKFRQATDLKQAGIIEEYMFKEVSGRGVVANVMENDTFNLTGDKRVRYYKVITEVQSTHTGNPYVVSFFYKNQDDVKDMVKGQPIEKTGSVLQILDEKLWVTVWLYVGEVGPEEKLMFGPPGAIPPKPDYISQQQ